LTAEQLHNAKLYLSANIRHNNQTVSDSIESDVTLYIHTLLYNVR